MTKWDYTFGVSLPGNITQKLEQSALLRSIAPHSATPGFEKDAFTPDGYPVEEKAYTVYPSLLHQIIGVPVFEGFAKITGDYRRRASVAALKWLEKVIGTKILHWTFNGLSFRHTVDGHDIPFCFPDTHILHHNGSSVENCAVLTFPDTHHNDTDWAYGTIPPYADYQAQLLLWCSKQYAAQNPGYLPVDKAFLVRIKGNLSVDNTIRTVTYDPRKVLRILAKIARAFSDASTTGVPLVKPAITIPEADWREEKQLDLDNAYHIEDPAFYNLLGKYMEARSIRKQLEEQAEQVKAQMDSIAIDLASQTGVAAARGEVEGNNMIYAVAHAKKRRYTPSISADLLRQLAPQYTEHIHLSSVPRGRITIDVL